MKIHGYSYLDKYGNVVDSDTSETPIVNIPRPPKGVDIVFVFIYSNSTECGWVSLDEVSKYYPNDSILNIK